MKKVLSKLDKPLLISIICFFIFGAIMVLSASSMESYMRYNYSPYHYFIRELFFLLIGFTFFAFIIFFPTKNYKKMDNMLMIIGFISLIMLLKYGHGANNAVSWYKFKIGPINLTIQPSEFVKIIIILYLSCYFNKYKDKLSEQWNIFRPFVFIGLFAILIIIQPDLGTSLIIILMSLMIFYAVPMLKKDRSTFNKIFIGSIVIVGIILGFAGNKILHSYQLERFNYFKPCDRYQEKSGYQLCNSFIAFKNGGLNGQGPGGSTQKYLYLSEAYTDFIFAIVVEECGLIIGILVLVGYMFVLLRIIKISRRCNNLQNSLICYGVFSYLLLHIMINLLGITGVIPLTGVPLPFLSYGGSYTVSLLIALGLVERIAVENNRYIDKIKNK